DRPERGATGWWGRRRARGREGVPVQAPVGVLVDLQRDTVGAGQRERVLEALLHPPRPPAGRREEKRIGPRGPGLGDGAHGVYVGGGDHRRGRQSWRREPQRRLEVSVQLLAVDRASGDER